MEIDPGEVSSDLDTGLVVLAYAATVAPCLDTLTDFKRDQAVAILKRVAADLPAAGTSRVSQQSRNGTSVSLREVREAISADNRAALRALCGGPSVGDTAVPVGSFPVGGMVESLWPESS